MNTTVRIVLALLGTLASVHCAGSTTTVSDAGAAAPATDASSPDAPATDASAESGAQDAGPFTLSSSAFQDKGTLPVTHTCDGAGTSPPLSWSGAPKGTTGFAVLATTLAKDGLKWNWVLYNIPANTFALPEGATNIGTAGLTSDGPKLAYSPPCSQGPGAKTYTFTIYALSGTPALPAQPNQVTGAVLTDAIKTMTLASSALDVSYTR